LNTKGLNDKGILADNGAYEDAAWLAADIGMFSETSEIYTKLNRYEKALAGYARGKQFKRMCNYIRKFIPYLLFCLIQVLEAWWIVGLANS